MSKDVLKYSTGSMENTAFADQFLEILQKQGNTKPVATAPVAPTEEKKVLVVDDSESAGRETLKEAIARVEASAAVTIPKASEIKEIGTVLDEATMADLRKRALDEKEAADAVGRKLFETRKKIRQVESDPTLKGTSVGENILAALRKDIARLKSIGDDHFQKRAEGFALVEEVREIVPEHIEKVREMYIRVISLGHRRVVSKLEIDKAQAAHKPLEGLIFFEGKPTVSVAQGDEKNGFYRALEAEVRKLTDKAKTSKVSIIVAVNLDLTGYGAGKPGAYQFHSPYHKGEDGREFFEGRAIVKLFDTNRERGTRPYIKIDITKAVGSLGWAENHPGKRTVPLDWVRNGSIPSEKKNEMSSDQVRYAEKVISNLRRIFGTWKKGLNPEVASVKPKPEGPAYTVPADNSDVIVEKVTTTVPATPAPIPEKPKATRKTKKAEK